MGWTEDNVPLRSERFKLNGGGCRIGHCFSDGINGAAVELPPITHDMPLRAIESWLRKPGTSPKEEMSKRSLRPVAPKETNLTKLRIW